MKTVAFIILSFLLLWHPATTATSGGSCGGDMAFTCAGCCACCVQQSTSNLPNPAAPVPSRPAANEQLTLLLPTITASLLLEQSSQTSKPSPLAELSDSAGALPLFRRDCALLL